MPILYDVQCYDLARAFLSDFNLKPERELHLADLMAQDIQRTIEDALNEYELIDTMNKD